MSVLKAPFPAFGGKSRIAAEVWKRLGDVRNYVEPFCFSAAMLLKRPGGAGAVETINDLNCYVANFWRAVRADPDAVAHHADWPVNETDLHARHKWLAHSDAAVHALTKVREDPEAFDAKVAGWWCWGACCWIGSGWCDTTHRNSGTESRINLGNDGYGNGVNRVREQIPDLSGDSGATGRGIHAGAMTQKMPHMDAAGRLIIGDPERSEVEVVQHKRVKLSGNGNGNGVHAGWSGGEGDVRIVAQPEKIGRVQLADEFTRGRGVNGNDAAGTCEQRSAWILSWMRLLSDRMRPVRVCCGHWDRICNSPSTMTRLGVTGVFLDPPYAHAISRVLAWIAYLRGEGPAPEPAKASNRTRHIYANDKVQDVDRLVAEVTLWCLKWGSNSDVRIAVCGLEGEYPALDEAGWEKIAWKSVGGYGNQSGAVNENAARERVWFSPHCVKETAGGLFGGAA